MTIASASRVAPKPLRCAIYTRVSNDENLSTSFNSLDAQRGAGEAYVLSQRSSGWTISMTRYDDGGYTGANMDRPALKALMTDIGAGRVDVVVVYKVDRLSRSLLDFAKILEVLENHEVGLVSVTQRLDTTSSMGRLTMNMLLSFAQFEREITAERIRDKMAASKRRGKWVGGIPPLGYRVDRERKLLVVDEAEAAVVRYVFDCYVELRSLTAVARDLNANGYRTKAWHGCRRTTEKCSRTAEKESGARPQTGGNESATGARGLWSANQVSRVLHNVTYLGKVAYRGEIYPGEHAAIVNEEVWRQAHVILGENEVERTKARCPSEAVLRGVVICGHHGSAMSPSHSRKGARRYNYYRCLAAQKRGDTACPVGAIAAHDLEARVAEELRSTFANAEAGLPAPFKSLGAAWPHLTLAWRHTIVRQVIDQVVVHRDRLELSLSLQACERLAGKLERWPAAPPTEESAK